MTVQTYLLKLKDIHTQLGGGTCIVFMELFAFAVFAVFLILFFSAV